MKVISNLNIALVRITHLAIGSIKHGRKGIEKQAGAPGGRRFIEYEPAGEA